MSGTSWDEIKRLAGELRLAQLGESAKKLSDRNCIELVSRLRNDGLIDVVYSTDGKEYITRPHLSTQICNEVIGNGGRIRLTELTDILGVGYEHIEERVASILAGDPTFVLQVGQLITQDYLREVFAEVNRWLSEEGTLTIGQITKAYDLPSDYLKNEINEAIDAGSIRCIRDRTDAHRIFTHDFVSCQKSIIRGILSSLTTPHSLKQIVSKEAVHSGLLFDCIDELLSDGDINGVLVGGRQIDRATFVPKIYQDAVARWVREYYAQNGYVEYGAVRKLGWNDDVRKLLVEDNNKPLVLSGCLLNSEIWDQCKSSIEAELQTHGWVDVMDKLQPEVVQNEEDARVMVGQVMANGGTTAGGGGGGGKKKGQSGSGGDLVVCGDTYLFSADKIVSPVLNLLIPEVRSKAEMEGPQLVKNLKLKQCQPPVAISDDTSGSGSGGGKKKGAKGKKAKGAGEGKRKGGGAGGDDEATGSGANKDLEFMNVEEIQTFLSDKWSSDCPEPILQELSDRLQPTLNAKFRECLESVFLSSEGSNKTVLKKSHAEFEDRYRSLFQNIYMFDLGASGHFDDNTVGQLRGLYLRTLCTDLVNLAVAYVGGIAMDVRITPKIRDGTVDGLPSPAKETFQRLIKSLGGKDELGDFWTAAEDTAALTVCGVSLKYPDKRAKADLVAKHEAELLSQLGSCSDEAQALILLLLILFCRTTGSMLHASGKFVPQLVSFIRPKIDPELYQRISYFQSIVQRKLTLKSSGADGNQDADLVENLSSTLAELKLKILTNVTEE